VKDGQYNVQDDTEGATSRREGYVLYIVLSILHDVPLPLRYLLGHCIVYPSRRLVTPSVSSWPLYCLSFTTSGYPFGIFMAIILSILHDVWLLLRYLLGHCIVYPSRRLVTPSVVVKDRQYNGQEDTEGVTRRREG
jgi:hypothetical protein